MNGEGTDNADRKQSGDVICDDAQQFHWCSLNEVEDDSSEYRDMEEWVNAPAKLLRSKARRNLHDRPKSLSTPSATTLGFSAAIRIPQNPEAAAGTGLEQ
jgi:hypothetical protein